MSTAKSLTHISKPTIADGSADFANQCIHCGTFLTNKSLSPFCCLGCEAVYSFLNKSGFSQYYELKKRGRSLRRASPAAQSKSSEKFLFLDDPEFLNLYSWSPSESSKEIAHQDPNDRIMEFYLEGVHCAACVWLTEQIPILTPGVKLVRLNLGNSIATVTLGKTGKFSQVAQEFLKMGYFPHPVKCDEEKTDQIRKREDRFFLIQLGVAGACAGNIMLLAISLYAGATGELAIRFKWISFFLFLPAFLFSGTPFYKSAWNALKLKQPSIDIPVVLGIMIGSLVSIINLFQGNSEIYFDSISGLIFLLLSTRYIFKRTQQSALNSSHLLHFITPSRVKLFNPKSQQFEDKALNQVTQGDILKILAGDTIPVDGIISQGTSLISKMLLTGESKRELTQIGDSVFAGTINLEAPLEIRVSESGMKTRLGKILKLMQETLHKKAPIITFADHVSRYFVIAILVISLVLLILGLVTNWHEGLSRALAVSLVTCPCAFALATPLTFSLTMGRLAKLGILVKRSETLEKLCKIRTIFLDKTGTLTYGSPKVLQWINHSIEDSIKSESIQAAIYSLELQSNHPIAQAITEYLKDQVKGEDLKNLEIREFKETLGKGIFGLVNQVQYEIQRARDSSQGTAIDIFRNSKKVATVILGDELRKDSYQSIQNLKNLNLEPWILSGDNKSAVDNVGRILEVPASHCISELSPEEKYEFVRKAPCSLMIGDGANDAIALATAHVGIAVRNSLEVSMRAADIYISRSGTKPISQLIILARETMKVIYRNFAFSIFYNITVGILAILGLISPLSAAILMPISAGTVIISSFLGTKKMRMIFREVDLAHET